MANVDAFILEHGFGCRTEIVPGDTMPTGTSMIERGQPDIAPEFWTNNFKEALARGVEEGRLQLVGQSLSDGGEEGFWVPKYMVEQHPELATIEGVMANAELFPHPESRRSFGFYGCPSGWGCQISSTNLFNALDLESAGFDYVDPGSGAALAGAIARAYERGQGWFGYYWAPTSVLGKYEMVKVDLAQGGVDEQHFVDCISQA
ncbi:glycine betaine ABC transporter substrate-binding protein, partial [Arthrospira platensis SPKY1]|nr:glycine betaine ABC transporter substrate-binding protein [Arthrospira platensis SPKY1]